jgi:hypothetical protein
MKSEAEKIFKELSNDRELKSVPIIYLSQIAIKVVNILIRDGYLLIKEDFD